MKGARGERNGRAKLSEYQVRKLRGYQAEGWTESELAASRTDLGPSLDAAFGAPNSTVRAENDVFDAAARAVPATTPYLYLDCGTRDVSFVHSNRKLVSNLSQRNLAYEYHETPGAHTWEYWDMRLPNMLAAVVKKIVPEKSE